MEGSVTQEYVRDAVSVSDTCQRVHVQQNCRRKAGRHNQRQITNKEYMAKIDLNPLLRSLRGRIGDLVFVQEGDSLTVRHAAENGTTLRSLAQKAHTNRFVVASRWARTLLADPNMRKLYQQGCHDHLTPHNVAVSDYMHAPVVDAIDLESYTGNRGDRIRILARDDFKIVRMAVHILGVDGQSVEEGEAEWDVGAAGWIYLAQAQVPAKTTVLIQVAALDLPGNRGTAKAYFYVDPVRDEARLTRKP